MSLPEAISTVRSLRGALRRMAGPFCAFSVTLAAVLAVVASTVVPRFLLLPVGGELLTPAQVEQKLRVVEADLAEVERRRDGHLSPVHDPAYAAMLTKRSAAPSLSALLRAAQQLAADVPGGNAIAVRDTVFDASTGRVTLTGDIRGIGASGMTTLSSFVDALGRLEMLDGVSLPGVERRDDPHDGVMIFFTIDCQFSSVDA